jgi:low molecular weight protein-tyrosine phosphatase
VTSQTDDGRLRVLSVCVGNICRSPVSEFLLREELGDKVDSTSAGTHALVGDPVYPPMAARLDGLGVPHRGGGARQVTEAILRQADLIVTMTRELRSRVVELAPATVRRAFTLAEFAAIVAASPRPAMPPAGRAELIPLIAAASAQRSAVAGHGVELDIADPYRRQDADYALAFEQIRRCVSTIGAAWN